jgi:hypothetical protein
MKVMVCHFVSDSHEVMTALIVVLPFIVVVEISLQLHRSSMVRDYIISPKFEHYTCIVDLLDHADHLQEVENMVMGMPWKPHVAPCMALLCAPRIHGNVEMAEYIAK